MVEINDKSKCCGCSACANICPKKCITMELDDEGFRYPRVNKNLCIDCGLCEKACIYLNEIVVKDKKPEPLQCYAVYNVDVKERLNSSSGGVFILFAKEIISRGGVVFGTKYCKTNGAEFVAIANAEDLYCLQGSKYVQSYIGDCFIKVKEFLSQNKQVLFSGTPCQIKALKRFLSDKDCDGLYCVDIFCHGVPGIKVYGEYVDWLEKKYGSYVEKINFRNKDEGWQNYSIVADFEDGQVYRCPFQKDPYMQIFLKDIALRPSCYSCISKNSQMQSDITIGDFWGCDDICPNMNDKKGLSAVIARSEKGRALMEVVNNKIRSHSVDIKDIANGNPSLIYSASQNGDRNSLFGRLGKDDFENIAKDVSKKRLIEKLKNKLWYIKSLIFSRKKK